jgi:thioredoxin reductase
LEYPLDGLDAARAQQEGLKPVTHELSTSISALFTAGDVTDRKEQTAIAVG